MKLLLLVLYLCSLTHFANGQSLNKNKEIIINFYKSFNERHFPTFYSIFSDSVLVHFSNNQSFFITPIQIEKSIDQQLKAFPEIQDTILNIITENNWVTICVKHAGINKDTLWGIPPTEKYVDYNVIEMYRLQKGKIVEIYVVEDFLSMYQQMGVLPKYLKDLIKGSQK